MSRTSAPLKPRILIIERNIEVQKRIAHTLDDAFTVDLTSSGSLAILLMKDYRYACIVASYELPNRHAGSGILKDLRRQPGGRYVPVIATASRTQPAHDEVTAEGFASLLRLPDDIVRLESVISEMLETWD